MPVSDEDSRVGERACAKVNLTLRVLGRRPDGYHELESLVTFADAGDIVHIMPGRPDGLTVGGPFADGIGGENLLDKTRALLREADPQLRIGAIHLDKMLPVAAGLGGGSADAAALLRAVRRANPDRAGDVPWMEIAAQLGSDVPVCLASRPALILGRGERIAPAARLPAISAVLVNPRVALPTAGVFAALNARPAPAPAQEQPTPQLPGLAELLDYMRAHGNDLEPAAIGLLPVIAEVKAMLAAQAGCLLAAMSGSGPTCFGVFTTDAEARGAAAALADARPRWWVAATAMSGAP